MLDLFISQGADNFENSLRKSFSAGNAALAEYFLAKGASWDAITDDNVKAAI